MIEKSNNRNNVAFIAALSAFLGFAENFIILPIPFFKLGIANIPICLAIPHFKFTELFLITLFKVIISHLYRGTIFSLPFIIGFTGNITFIVTTWIIYKIFNRYISFVTLSIIGAISHNAGQIIGAYFLMPHNVVLMISIFLVTTGIFTGFINGIICNNINVSIMKRLDKIKERNLKYHKI